MSFSSARPFPFPRSSISIIFRVIWQTAAETVCSSRRRPWIHTSQPFLTLIAVLLAARTFAMSSRFSPFELKFPVFIRAYATASDHLALGTQCWFVVDMFSTVIKPDAKLIFLNCTSCNNRYFTRLTSSF